MPPTPRVFSACRPCRTRKIKCDRREPRCVNCERAGWECEWYGPTSTVVFRDETIRVKRRSEATFPCPRHRHGTIEESRSSSTVWYAHKHSRFDAEVVLPLQSSLPNSLDELALSYFFFKHILNTATARRTVIEDGNGCLLMAMRALGVAGVMQDSSCREVQQRYVQAIRLTNEALASPALVRRDSTLLAIHLLSILETMTRSDRSMDSWRSHIFGASALIRLRGAQQFQGSEGGRLFLQIGVGLAISCLQQRVAVPHHYWDVFRENEQDMPDREGHMWKIMVLLLHFADLYAELLPTNHPRSSIHAISVVKRSFETEENIFSIIDSLPESWRPATVYANNPATFGTYYFVYQTSLMAQAITGLRSIRILLMDILIKSVASCGDIAALQLSPAQIQRLQDAPAIVKQLQSDILAAVPQHLGDFMHPGGFQIPDDVSVVTDHSPNRIWKHFASTDVNPWALRGGDAPEVPSVRMGGGFLLHWPLYVAGAADAPDGAVRAWVVNALSVMGDRVGVHHAHILADLLRSNDDSTTASRLRLCDFAQAEVSPNYMRCHDHVNGDTGHRGLWMLHKNVKTVG